MTIYLKILSDKKQLKNFEIRPSGMRDKAIIKHLVDGAELYATFLQLISKLGKELTL